MNGPAPADRPSEAPRPASDPSDRLEVLAAYFERNEGRYTTEALRQRAVEAYSADEIEGAIALAERHRRAVHAIGPTKTRARWIIVAAYVIVWLPFAWVFLTTGPGGGLDFGQLMLAILTVSLIIGLLLSMAWVSRRRPDPTQIGRAMVGLLVVPVILLLGVAGICLPFAVGY